MKTSRQKAFNHGVATIVTGYDREINMERKTFAWFGALLKMRWKLLGILQSFYNRCIHTIYCIATLYSYASGILEDF